MITLRCVGVKPEDKKLPDERPAEYTLYVGNKYMVGRKNKKDPIDDPSCISFADDSSLSREHAEIEVEHPIANVTNPMFTPCVVVTDLGSKFGTAVNEQIERRSKLTMRDPVTLTDKDRIKFGLQWNEFEIEITKLVVTSSNVDSKGEYPLKKTIMTLGGFLVPEWTKDCDYLVMDSLKLTVKAVCALIAQKYIVTPSFFQDFLEAVKIRKKSRPKPRDYLPTVMEDEIKDYGTFEPGSERANIFQGKTFIFCNPRNRNKFSPAIELGKGRCVLTTDISIQEALEPHCLVMKPEERDQITAGQHTRKLFETYVAKGKRFIKDAEIAFAVVFKSLDKNCNPNFQHDPTSGMDPEILESQPSSSERRGEVLVPETQTQDSSSAETQSFVEATFDELARTSTSSVSTGGTKRKAAEPAVSSPPPPLIKKEPGGRDSPSQILGLGGDSQTQPPPKGKGKDNPVVIKQEGPPTKKSKVDNNSTAGTTTKDQVQEDDSVPPSHEVVLIPLIKKKLYIQPMLQVFHGKNVKNFKQFKKILPLPIQRNSTFGSTADEDSTFISSAASSRREEQERSKSKIQFEIYNANPIIVEDEEKVDMTKRRRLSSPEPSNNEDDGPGRGGRGGAVRKRGEASRKEPVPTSSSRMKRTVSMDVADDDEIMEMEMEEIMQPMSNYSSTRGQGGITQTQSSRSTRSTRQRSNINASSQSQSQASTTAEPESTSPQRPVRTKRPRLQYPIQESRKDDLFEF